MKVKLLVSRSGADGSFSPGEEIEVGDAEALRMVEAGQAVIVGREKETATKKKVVEKRA